MRFRLGYPISSNVYSPWLSMYIQGLLRNDKESLIPDDCHCGETNCTAYDPNILIKTRMILIDNQFAQRILNEILLRVVYQYALIEDKMTKY